MVEQGTSSRPKRKIDLEGWQPNRCARIVQTTAITNFVESSPLVHSDDPPHSMVSLPPEKVILRMFQSIRLCCPENTSIKQRIDTHRLLSVSKQ